MIRSVVEHCHSSLARLRSIVGDLRFRCCPNNKITPLSDEHSEDDMTSSPYKKNKLKVPWYYAPAFLLFWVMLLFAAVVPIFFHLPDGLTIDQEAANPGEFIAERAERILFDFDLIGPKVVGSYANENLTVQLLLDELEQVRRAMNHDLFSLEVDVQQVSGAYMHWTMVNMYQGLQNVVVKFAAKNATSQSYLLINSHFDSKPGSPGSGDDGAMVVIMLEVLRVLATGRQVFAHPVVFLFNGAEENPLQASHGFITQHKWAKNCKTLINLDSAGSGHKEILFQSGPNHPWLMQYYRKNVRRPYATTMAEELFQANIIPSDTDFRIFRDYGSVPGLDFAHSYNGYVYHTAFDKANVIPRGTLQNTGDNILSLTRAFANAPELEDPSTQAEGHTVFYDFLGLFFIFYTETQGVILNICISVAGLLLVGASLWRMAASSYLSIGTVLRSFLWVFLLHLVGFVLAFALPMLMAVLFDSGDRSMTWFTHKWLVLGLYICPSLFGFALPTLLYLSFNRNDKLTQPYKLHMILHSHCIVLSVLCIVLTILGIRTAYLLMISILFYSVSLVFNLLTTLHGRGYYWTIFLKLSQIMPFLYFAYLIHCFLCTLMPMMGRFGSTTNPDFYIGGLCALGTVLSMGFVIPLLNLFRRPKLILLSLAVVTFVFSMMAITPLGFPYRAKTHVGRVNFLHVRRVFYEFDKSVSRNESGYYFDFQDRRMHYPIESTLDLTGMESISDDCDDYMMCGLPVFNHRWYKTSRQGKWLPTDSFPAIANPPTLTLLNRTVNAVARTAHYEFQLSGPPHMSIFLQPLEGVDVLDWSFLKDMLQKPDEYQPPYHIYFSYGNDNSPLKFHIDFKVNNGKFEEPLFELGISAHYVSSEHPRSPENLEFVKSFPDYIFVMEWPSSYERYIF